MSNCIPDLEMIQGQLNEIIEILKPDELREIDRSKTIEYQVDFTYNFGDHKHTYTDIGSSFFDVLERFVSFLKHNYRIKNITDIQISIKPLYENENTSNS